MKFGIRNLESGKLEAKTVEQSVRKRFRVKAQSSKLKEGTTDIATLRR